MRRIVLDTNCLLQALPSRSPYHKIWTEVLAGNIILCVNNDTHFNILKHIDWPKLNVTTIKDFARQL